MTSRPPSRRASRSTATRPTRPRDTEPPATETAVTPPVKKLFADVEELFADMFATQKAIEDDPVVAFLRREADPGVGQRRRRRPAATPDLAPWAVVLRGVYERKRQEFNQRSGAVRRRGDPMPSERAFAWVAQRFAIGQRRLRRTLFSRKTSAGYRAQQAADREWRRALDAAETDAEVRALLDAGPSAAAAPSSPRP